MQISDSFFFRKIETQEYSQIKNSDFDTISRKLFYSKSCY